MIVNTKKLTESVDALCAITPRRVGNPVLQCIHLSAVRDSLTLHATDMQTDAEVTIPCEGDGDFSAVADGRQLLAALKGIPKAADIVKVTAHDHALHLHAVGSDKEVMRIPGTGFPAMLEVPELTVGEIDPQGLRRAILHATPSPDATKPTLSALNLHSDAHGLRMASTDGFRITLTDLSSDPGPEVQVLVHRDSLKPLAKLLKSCRSPLALRVDSFDHPRFAALVGPGIVVSLRLEGGNYPQYRKVIPGELRHSVRIPTKALAEALKSAMSASDEYFNNVKLVFEFPTLKVIFEHPDNGVSTSGLTVGQFGSGMPDFQTAFKGDYLKDVCAALKDHPELIYQFNDEISTGAWSADGATTRVLLMPVRYADQAASAFRR